MLVGTPEEVSFVISTRILQRIPPKVPLGINLRFFQGLLLDIPAGIAPSVLDLIPASISLFQLSILLNFSISTVFSADSSRNSIRFLHDFLQNSCRNSSRILVFFLGIHFSSVQDSVLNFCWDLSREAAWISPDYRSGYLPGSLAGVPQTIPAGNPPGEKRRAITIKIPPGNAWEIQARIPREILVEMPDQQDFM